MTTNNERTMPRRTFLILVAVGIAVAIAVLAVVLIVVVRGGGEPAPTPAPTSTDAASASTGVDACMGGADLTADALFTAQRDAAHTPEGAVSYAAAFARYTYQLPFPSDVADVASSNALGADKWAAWEAAYDSWTGPNPFSTTTTNGSYRVQSYTPDEAVVTVALPMIVDGAITSQTFVPTITLGRSVGGAWTVTDIDNSAATDSARLTDSTDFVNGC